MIARQWDHELDDATVALPQPGSRLRDQPSPIGPMLGQNLLDEPVRALQEDLALLQAEQERGLDTVNGTLERIGRELAGMRAQIDALSTLSVAAPVVPAESESGVESTTAPETNVRFERLEQQVGMLARGMESVELLRYQSDVHTRALARLTDLLGEVVRPKPVEGLAELQHAVAVLEEGQRRTARRQVVALSMVSVGLMPGLGAVVWLVARGVGLV
jgi:hypothetical protein